MFTLIVQVVINELRCMAPKRFPRTYIRRQTCLSKQFSNIYSSEFYYLIRYNRKKLHLFIAQQRFLSGCSTILSLFRISLWLCKYVILKPVFLFVYKFLLLNFFFLFLLCCLTGLDHQGIFRLSGSTTEINDMKQLFENGNKTERCMLLLCHVHLTRRALTFTQTTCIYMKTFNPLVTASEWRKNRIFHQHTSF